MLHLRPPTRSGVLLAVVALVAVQVCLLGWLPAAAPIAPPTHPSVPLAHPPGPPPLPTAHEASNSTVHVISSVRGVYVWAVLACISSIVRSAKRPVEFHLICINQEDVRILRHLLHGQAEVGVRGPRGEPSRPVPVDLLRGHTAHVLLFDRRMLRVPIKVWDGRDELLDPLNYARFYLPSLFPHLSTVVYLDPDTVVANNNDIGNLLDLFLTMRERPPPTPFFMAAIASPRLTLQDMLFCDAPGLAPLGINCSSIYFNAGVFVTDLQAWRHHNITARLERLLLLNSRSRLWKWGSQPPLNIVFYRAWAVLGPLWNFRWFASDAWKNNVDDVQSQPHIMHFVGSNKPWTTKGRNTWRFWCPHFPFQRFLWFCAEGARAPVPASPYDYHFTPALTRPWYCSRLSLGRHTEQFCG
eukprot:CAMPEP_0177637026 /NCGR_PEP_ID=MMETSP0447-20121125/4755_1 /TAXON_ID=0 /ORGANISM="Stygamoeba regulata, Strain BSH-02190019" /LENGTH=411 /DNA_ID=CAMNT_0019138933 /DNA_START=45 /DNA_END=1280 /DNA_ORIENTATION=-